MTAPAWLTTMRAITGTLEAPGSADNPTILAWRDEIARRYPDMAAYCANYTHDSIAWCGLTIAYCMAVNGIRPVFGKTDTDKFLWANAWQQFGTRLDKPKLGCVMVFTREGGGHVSLYEGEEGNNYVIRGGNQSDSVNVTRMAKSKFSGAFWPSLANADRQVDPPPVPAQLPPKSAGFPFDGRGSWYSQFSGRYEWVDTGDAPGSAALGVPDNAQGVAFYDRRTLGDWFEVRAPNGVTSIEQQTDIGPHPNTGRQIDISAAAAERFGYSPKNFPTDGIFSWRPIEPPASVRGQTPKLQASMYRDLRPATPDKPPIAGPVAAGTAAAGGAAALLYNGQFMLAAVLVIAAVIGLVAFFRLRE